MVVLTAALGAAPASAAPQHWVDPVAVRIPPASFGAPAAALAASPTLRAVGTRAARSDPRSSVAAGPVLHVAGHGAGAGVGLGQFGAFGYATERHESWQWITAHYYAGAHVEPVAAAVDQQPVDVDLSELDHATATTVRVGAGATLSVNGRVAASTTVRVGHPKGQTVTVVASSGDLQVQLPRVGWRSYRGEIQIQPDGATWNVLPLESYLAGVVPAESVASWGAVPGGEAALQAQAVAARSYALATIAARGWICDTAACQDYLGDPATQGLGASLAYALSAVSSTSGEVVCLATAAPCPLSSVAVAQYGASTGGYTEAVAAPGETFAAVPDDGDAVAGNPYHTWTSGSGCPTTLSAAAVAKDFGLTSVAGAKVTARNGVGAFGGRALEVLLLGRKGGGIATVTVPGGQFAATVGLCSDWFAFY